MCEGCAGVGESGGYVRGRARLRRGGCRTSTAAQQGSVEWACEGRVQDEHSLDQLGIVGVVTIHQRPEDMDYGPPPAPARCARVAKRAHAGACGGCAGHGPLSGGGREGTKSRPAWRESTKPGGSPVPFSVQWSLQWPGAGVAAGAAVRREALLGWRPKRLEVGGWGSGQS